MEITNVLKQVHSKFIDKPFHFQRTVNSNVNIIDTRVPEKPDSHLPDLSRFSFVSSGKVELVSDNTIQCFYQNIFSEYFTDEDEKPFVSTTAKNMFEFIYADRVSEELLEDEDCNFEYAEQHAHSYDDPGRTAKCDLTKGFWRCAIPGKNERFTICPCHYQRETSFNGMGSMLDWCPLFHDSFETNDDFNTLLYNINPDSPMYHWVAMSIQTNSGWRLYVLPVSLSFTCSFIDKMYKAEDQLDEEMKKQMPYPMVMAAAMMQNFSSYYVRYQ
jgi:hypothetical protein